MAKRGHTCCAWGFSSAHRCKLSRTQPSPKRRARSSVPGKPPGAHLCAEFAGAARYASSLRTADLNPLRIFRELLLRDDLVWSWRGSVRPNPSASGPSVAPNWSVGRVGWPCASAWEELSAWARRWCSACFASASRWSATFSFCAMLIIRASSRPSKSNSLTSSERLRFKRLPWTSNSNSGRRHRQRAPQKQKCRARPAFGGSLASSSPSSGVVKVRMPPSRRGLLCVGLFCQKIRSVGVSGSSRS